VRAMLSIAVRSGWLLAGRTAVREALETRSVALVVLARDAQQALQKEITAGATAGNIPCHTVLTAADLSRYHRGKPLAVLGIRHRGLARRLHTEISKEYALTTSVEKTNLEVVF
jgi:ribosomal protein L7Ae-like RNA K-turn-binding protein